MKEDLWRLSQQGNLTEFAKKFDPKQKDPNGVNYWYGIYRGIKDKNQLSSLPTSSSSSSFSSSGSLGDLGIKEMGIMNKIKTAFNLVDNVAKTLVGIGQNTLSTQLISDRTGQIDFTNKLLENFRKNGLDPLGNSMGFLEMAGGQIVDFLTKETQLRYNINRQTSLTGELSDKLREDMKLASVEVSKYGYSLENLGELYTSLVANSGKLALISKETMMEISPVAGALNMSLQDFASTAGEFEKVGIGLDDTKKSLDDLTPKTLSLGLSSAKIAKELKDNVGRLNEYGFKNGVEGLTRMVQKSNEFRMSMDSVFSVANKVFTPESAIDLAANLQVLGGAIGDFNDPLKLMYMATNNVEGLQDALIGAAQGLATYNEKQGRFEVTSTNLRRAKEMADQFGISMGELNKIAIAAAERSSASAEMFAKGLNVTDEDKEFLTNLSKMENGKMVIEIPESLATKIGQPTKIAMENFDQNMANQLLENRKEFKELSTKDMASKQLTATENMARDLNILVSYEVLRYAQISKGVGKSLYDSEGENLKKLLKERNDEMRAKFKQSPSGEEYGKNLGNKLIKPVIDDGFFSGLKEGVKTLWKIGTGEGLDKTSQVIDKKVTYRHEFVADNVLDKVRREAIQNSAMGIAFNDDDPDDTRQYEKASKAERIYIS